MPNVNAAVRRVQSTKNQLQVVADIIALYKSLGYRIVDGIETVMIEEKDATFRIFISRISHVLQIYYLGEWDCTVEYSTKYLESAERVREFEVQFKELYG